MDSKEFNVAARDRGAEKVEDEALVHADALFDIEAVRDYMDTVRLDDYALGGCEITEDDLYTIRERVSDSGSKLEDVVHEYLLEIREVLDAGLDDGDMEFDGDLPECVTIPVEDLELDEDELEDEDILTDIVGDYLSDTYGYCHFGFSLEVVYGEDGEPEGVVVTDIEWDCEQEQAIAEVIENANERASGADKANKKYEMEL